jgi:bifunctional oligoribonuclease and PAP phosphatase NrnA
MKESKLFISQLEMHEKFLLVIHRNPDGDALGSATALCLYIESLNKSAKIFCVDPVPEALGFLNANRFITKSDELILDQYDIIITIDCGDIKQTGIADMLKEINVPIINIDHHETNNCYGTINIVEPKASATSEIIFNIFKKAKVNLSKEITTSLMTGIMTDTTYFSNAATTKNSVSITGELLNKGARLKEVVKNTWNRHNAKSLRLWGDILSNLHYNAEYKIAIAIIGEEYINVNPDVFDGLANFLTNLYDANIIIVMRQTTAQSIKCSLRTTKENVNVAELAKYFGGGGHQKAAGFSLLGKLKKTKGSWEII